MFAGFIQWQKRGDTEHAAAEEPCRGSRGRCERPTVVLSPAMMLLLCPLGCHSQVMAARQRLVERLHDLFCHVKKFGACSQIVGFGVLWVAVLCLANVEVDGSCEVFWPNVCKTLACTQTYLVGLVQDCCYACAQRHAIVKPQPLDCTSNCTSDSGTHQPGSDTAAWQSQAV